MSDATGRVQPASFEEAVAGWVLDHDWPKRHEGHTIAHPTLTWSHEDGYSYSEYTQEDPKDSVRVTGDCSCGEAVSIFHTFYGSDLTDFLTKMSAPAREAP